MRQQCRSWNGFERHAGTWLSRLPLTINWKIAGTSGWSVPISQSQTTVFVGQWMEWDSLPPCIVRSFTSLQMVHTHTCMLLSTYIYICIYLSVCLSIYLSMYLCIYVSCMHACMDGWTDGRMDGRTDGWMDVLYVCMYLYIYMIIYVCVFRLELLTNNHKLCRWLSQFKPSLVFSPFPVGPIFIAQGQLTWPDQ